MHMTRLLLPALLMPCHGEHHLGPCCFKDTDSWKSLQTHGVAEALGCALSLGFQEEAHASSPAVGPPNTYSRSVNKLCWHCLNNAANF